MVKPAPGRWNISHNDDPFLQPQSFDVLKEDHPVTQPSPVYRSHDIVRILGPPEMHEATQPPQLQEKKAQIASPEVPSDSSMDLHGDIIPKPSMNLIEDN